MTDAPNKDGRMEFENPFRSCSLDAMLTEAMAERGETMADVEYITDGAYVRSADFVRGEVITRKHRYIGEQLWVFHTPGSDDMVTRQFLRVVSR